MKIIRIDIKKDVIKIDAKSLDYLTVLSKLKEKLDEIELGEVVALEFTSPEAAINIPKYCQQYNHEILRFDVLYDSSWIIVVRK